MKKKLATLLLALCIFTACSSPAEQDEMEQMLQKVEQALGEDYEKQIVTKVYDFEFINDQDDMMILHLCLTTYYGADPEDVTGLNTAALSAVFDLEGAQLQKEFTVSEHPAAIYQDETHAYLCWTSSPETSAVLDHTPGAISEENALRIVQSVYKYPNREK